MTAPLELNMAEPVRWAQLSPCETYRYTLGRRWATGPMGLVIGVNPSRADAETDDSTVRVLYGFGRRWGWAGYHLANPFAYRATDQRELLAAADPVGPENDAHLEHLLRNVHHVVVAWGAGKTAAVRRLLDARLRALRPLFAGRQLWCLCRTGDGAPHHPLRLAYETPLQRWEWP